MSATLLCRSALLPALWLTTAAVGFADDGRDLHWNPFVKPPLLAKPVRPSDPAGPVEPEAPPVLSGTLVSATAPMAILDGQLLSVGDEHAGYRLVSVQEGAATFDKQGEAVRLMITGPVAETGNRR